MRHINKLWKNYCLNYLPYKDVYKDYNGNLLGFESFIIVYADSKISSSDGLEKYSPSPPYAGRCDFADSNLGAESNSLKIFCFSNNCCNI